ncbi:MAG: hypothetical protein IJR14_10230, partial [Synergistaceae bacterium]|nr:hypothetical protein [Synergistaceae bacterium]
TRAVVRLFREIEPDVHLNMGGLTELASLPSIVLTGPSLTERGRAGRDAERLTEIDEEAWTAVREMPPRWYHMRFDVALAYPAQLPLMEAIERCGRLVQARPLIEAQGSGGRVRRYSWEWTTPPVPHPAPNVAEVHEGRGVLTVHDVELYSGLAEVVPLIRRVAFDIDGERLEIGG